MRCVRLAATFVVVVSAVAQAKMMAQGFGSKSVATSIAALGAVPSGIAQIADGNQALPQTPRAAAPTFSRLHAPGSDAPGTSTQFAAAKARIASHPKDLRMMFEVNRGQSDPQVKFLAHGRGYGLYLTGRDAEFSLGDAGCMAKNPALTTKLSVGSSDRSRSVELSPKRSKQSALDEVCSKKISAFRMSLQGVAATPPPPTGEDELAGKVNYFVGQYSGKWHTDIPLYARVRYAGVYPGVDLVYYGNDGRLEYDFIVAPKADPSQIRLNFGGVSGIQLNHNGDLSIAVGDGKITLAKPQIYQTIGGQRKPVEGSFQLVSNRSVGFQLGSYNRAKPLVIDPVLVYSTYLGGAGSPGVFPQDPGNEVTAVATDALGDTYVAGFTYALNFPVSAGALQSANGAPSQDASGAINGNAFVTEFDPNGGLIFSTYLGGSGPPFPEQDGFAATDGANAIAVDTSGIYVAGYAVSTNFPTTADAFQRTFHTKTPPSGCAYPTPQETGFVAKLSPTGASLLYSTYLGGSGQVLPSNFCTFLGEEISAIAVDAAGDTTVAGTTYSTDFPTTTGAFQTANHTTIANPSSPNPLNAFGTNGFISKLNPTGSSLLYSTYLGGNASDSISALQIDALGSTYVAGIASSSNFPVTPSAFQTFNSGTASGVGDPFVAKLNPTGTSLSYATFVGPSTAQPVGNNSVGGIAVDSSGNAYIAGGTTATNFPVTAGAFQAVNKATATGSPTAFLSKLNSDGSTLVYSTYLGGSTEDQAFALAVDPSGDAFVAGDTFSSDFPSTVNALQRATNDSNCNKLENAPSSNGFITEFNPQGTAVLYSTFLGGSNYNADFYYEGDQINALALDATGNVYVGGIAGSTNFPVTYNALQAIQPNSENQYSGFVSKLDLTATSVTPAVAVSPATFAGGASPLTVTTTVSSIGGPPPTGTIQLEAASYDGDVVDFSATLSNGSAQFAIPANTLPVNTIGGYNYCLIARYTPDAQSYLLYNPSEGQGTPSSLTQVTVDTQPAGLSFSVDGTAYTSTQTFSWNVGDTHMITTTTPQSSSGTSNAFSDWSDGGALSHAITVSGVTTYTANFTTSYQLTESANPTAGGTVTPASGSFYSADTVAPVQATPNSGYTFSGWTGPVASATSASTTVTMSAPETVTANFTASSAQTATVVLSNLDQTYTGSALPVTATTNPAGLSVSITYNGSATPPTAAGTYAVVATVTSSGYSGSASGTLVINKASATVTIGSQSATYTGAPISATATTTPSGLSVAFTYNGSTSAPTNAGTYTVVGTVTDPNHTGLGTGSLVINKATATITLGNLTQVYTGSPLSVTVTVVPAGLSVSITYNGSATAPTAVGNYAVVATVDDPNYTASVTGTLQITNALPATVTLSNLTQTYTGSPLSIGISTNPANLKVAVTYNGSATSPVNAGSYAVSATVTSAGYAGTATGTLSIRKASSTTAISASATTVAPGQSAVLTATVLAVGATGSPTGNVTFYDGITLLSTVVLVNGTATYSTPALSTGTTHIYTAVYSGDGNLLSSTSNNSATVLAALLDFTFANTGTTAYTAVPGAVATYNFTLAPLYGTYAGPVSFTVMGMPAGMTASFTPNSIAVNGGAASVVMTVQTTAAVAQNRNHPFRRGIVLALLLLPFVAKRRTRRKLKGRLLLLVFLVAGLTATLSGCGATNGFLLQNPQTYTLTVTATSGTLQHSQTVTLIVQ